MSSKRRGTSELPECQHSAYIYLLVYATHYRAYIGGGGYGPPEYVCWATVWRLPITPTVITHIVNNMVREVSYYLRDYAYMNEGTSELLFMEHTAAAAERLKSKAWLW